MPPVSLRENETRTPRVAVPRVAVLVVVAIMDAVLGLLAFVPIGLLQLSLEEVRPSEPGDWFVPALFVLALLCVVAMGATAAWALWRSFRPPTIVCVVVAVVAFVVPLLVIQLW